LAMEILKGAVADGTTLEVREENGGTSFQVVADVN
jgi:hypothetical protein